MPTQTSNAWEAFEGFCEAQDALHGEIAQAIEEIALRYGYEADVRSSWETKMRFTESSFTVTWFEVGALSEALDE